MPLKALRFKVYENSKESDILTIASLKHLKKVEIEVSELNKAVLELVQSIPFCKIVPKRPSPFRFRADEDWPNERLSSIAHMFIPGQEPMLDVSSFYDPESIAPIKLFSGPGSKFTWDLVDNNTVNFKLDFSIKLPAGLPDF